MSGLFCFYMVESTMTKDNSHSNWLAKVTRLNAFLNKYADRMDDQGHTLKSMLVRQQTIPLINGKMLW